MAAIGATANLLAVPYNTGVDDANALLASGAQDMHWGLTYTGSQGGYSPIPVVATAPPVGSPWVANTSSAQWLTPYAVGDGTDPWLTDPVGLFTYTQTFNSGSDRTANVSFASDNLAKLYVNGTLIGDNSAVLTPYGDPGYGGWTTYSVNFLTGGNTIMFEVDNKDNGYTYVPPTTGNPSGLIASIPDGGSTLALLGASFLGLGILRRKLA